MSNLPHPKSSIASSLRPLLGRWALICLLLGGLAVANGGCKSRPNHKAEARAEWNAARGRVLLGLAEDQYRHGNLKESRSTCTEGLKLTDRVPDLYVLKAKLDIEEGELMAARTALEAALTIRPNDAGSHYLKGIIAERWNEPAEALTHYQAAATAEPGELAYLLATAEMLVELNRADEAGEMLEGKLIYFESNAPIRDMLAQIRIEQERFDEAADLFRRAAILAPGEGVYREREALAVLAAGRAQRAVDLLEKLLEQPENAERVSLQLALGEAQLQAGNAAAARATFQRATRIESNNLMAWMGVAKATVETGETARAELAMSRVSALNPTPRQAADLALLRGYLRLQQDRVSDAGRSFAEAGRLDPTDPLALVMYGICLERLGRSDEAVSYWGRALELDPSDELARQMLDRHVGADFDTIVP